MKDLREKALSGAAWTAVSQAGRQSAVLLSTIVMARLLPPSDFGVVATAVIFSNFTFILSEQGFLTALIQREEVSQLELSSAFWLNLGIGAVLACAFALAAPGLARWYAMPELELVMRVISLMFLLYPLGMIHKAILTRGMDIRRVAIVESVAAWSSAAAGVGLAFAGFGVASIAAQFVLEYALASAGLWLASGWRPALEFRWRSIRGLAGFSTNILVLNLGSYAVRNLDNFLIGLRLGAHALGLYSRAYSIMLFPLTRLSWVFSRLIVRSLAILKSEIAAVRAVFLKVTRVVALITFPMMLGVIATAEPFVAVVFGPRWGEMVPILRVLALAGMIQSVTTMFMDLYSSLDKTGLRLRVAAPIQALQIAGIVAGLGWGAYGVACGYAAATALAVPIECRWGMGLVGASGWSFVSNLSGVFLCAAAMAAAVAALEGALPADLSALARLGTLAAAGGALYWGLLAAFRVQAYEDLRDIALERLGLAGRAA